MIRTLRMLSPLWLRPLLLLPIPFISWVLVVGGGRHIEWNIWSPALVVPVMAGVWLRIMREEYLSLRVLWVAPEYHERYFRGEIAIVLVLSFIVAASFFSELGLLFALQAFALALLVFVLVDGAHWRDRTTWPAIVLRVVVAAGIVKPDWAMVALESQPLVMTAAMLAAVVVLRSGNRLTAVARKLTSAARAGLFGLPDVDVESSSQAAEAASDHLPVAGSAERPSLWQASDSDWRRAAYYETGQSMAGVLFILAIAFVSMFGAESMFITYAYVLLGLASMRLRLQTFYPLSRRRRRNIHFTLSQASLLVAVVVLAAAALIAGRIESLWGGSGMGWNAVLVQSALIIGSAPLVQFPRKRHMLGGLGIWLPLMWAFFAAIGLHGAGTISILVLHHFVPSLELLWYAIAFAISGQIVNWQRLRRYFAHEDLI